MPFRKKCEGCGVMFVAPCRRQRFHKFGCWVEWRKTQDWWRVARQKGLQTRLIKRALAVAQASRSRVDAYLAGVRDGRRAAYKVGEDRGRRHGWAEALGERKSA